MGGACLCDGVPSEDALPSSRTSSALSQVVSSTDGCPARPAWAGDLDDDIEIELLHVRVPQSQGVLPQGRRVDSELGTGYRLRSSGQFETYDTVAIDVDQAGKVAFKNVAGRWKSRGMVDAEARVSLLRLIAEQDPKVLEGKWRTEGDAATRTHLLTRRDGGWVELCYVGSNEPRLVRPVVKGVYNLMGQLGESKD